MYIYDHIITYNNIDEPLLLPCRLSLSACQAAMTTKRWPCWFSGVFSAGPRQNSNSLGQRWCSASVCISFCSYLPGLEENYLDVPWIPQPAWKHLVYPFFVSKLCVLLANSTFWTLSSQMTGSLKIIDDVLIWCLLIHRWLVCQATSHRIHVWYIC